MPFFLLNYLRVSVPLWLDLLQKLNRPPIPGRTDGRFLETCLQVLLAKHLATAHRPTVPPSGERTVIVVAIAVALTVHFLRASHLAKRPDSLAPVSGMVKLNIDRH